MDKWTKESRKLAKVLQQTLFCDLTLSINILFIYFKHNYLLNSPLFLESDENIFQDTNEQDH